MRALNYDDNPHEPRKFPISLVFDHVKNPRNVGMLFRLAESMGVQHIYFCNDSIHPPNRKLRKAARSTIKLIPYTVMDDIEVVLNNLKEANSLIAGLEITDSSIPIREFKPPSDQPIALVIGSEKYGLSDQALNMLDLAIHIPLYGENLSINVATATAIALFEITGKLS